VAPERLVVTVASVENVVAVGAEQLVIPAEALDPVYFRRAMKRVVVGRADQLPGERRVRRTRRRACLPSSGWNEGSDS
jgi:hypothetical protein